MAAADYVTIEGVTSTSTVKNVQIKEQSGAIRVPKAALIAALAAKMDADAGITDTDYAATTADS